VFIRLANTLLKAILAFLIVLVIATSASTIATFLALVSRLLRAALAETFLELNQSWHTVSLSRPIGIFSWFSLGYGGKILYLLECLCSIISFGSLKPVNQLLEFLHVIF